MKGMRILYISLGVVLFCFVLVFSYMHPYFQGHAIQENTFNLEVEIPSIYNTATEGSTIHFTTKIFNLGGEDRMDVSLRYDVVEATGVILVSKTETMAIETQASFVGSIDIPTDIEEGTYSLRVTLLVNGEEEAHGGSSFRITKEDSLNMNYVYVAAVVLALIVIIFFFASRVKVMMGRAKLRRRVRSIVQHKLKK